jgi:hypothetical protein
MRATIIASFLLLPAALCLALPVTAAIHQAARPMAGAIHRRAVKPAAAGPVIASLSPDRVSLLQPPGRDPQPSSTTLVVHGSGFRRGAHVLWGGDPQETEFVSGSQLSVVLDWRLLAPVPRQDGRGPTISHVRVSVRNPAGKPSRPVVFDVTIGAG